MKKSYKSSHHKIRYEFRFKKDTPLQAQEKTLLDRGFVSTRSGKSHMIIVTKSFVQVQISVHRKRKGGVFKILQFEERFRKASFS